MTQNQLSRSLLTQLVHQPSNDLSIPEDTIFQLPEKVLQFGTGVLLRGLPDFFIDKANRQGQFNGRIVVVKSTDAGSSDVFSQQDGLYTLCQRGLTGNEATEQFVICSAISRVLAAKEQWEEVLQCAHNPDLQIIISNTTEVGIQLMDDSIRLSPPDSFPGKLTAFLYERFLAFGGSAASGMVIIPCELLVDNGRKLKEIVLALARQNNLEDSFSEWVEQQNQFCNSLVDRIVTGMPDRATADGIYERLGYRDDLLTVSETYRLWAIEGNAHAKQVMSFAGADEGVTILTDIQPYRERKLRLLNGTHTLMVGLGYLCGLNTVGECMQDAAMRRFVQVLMEEEIVPAVPVDRESAVRFMQDVIARFSNPYIVHPLINITVQYTSKMRMRNVQTLLNYYERHQTVPTHFALGFAAYLLFMRVVKQENGKYFGERKGESYPIQDDAAAHFREKWRMFDASSGKSISELVASVTADQTLWGADLSALPNFTDTVSTYLKAMMQDGANPVLNALIESKAKTV